jgi:hypothetical protein
MKTMETTTERSRAVEGEPGLAQVLDRIARREGEGPRSVLAIGSGAATLALLQRFPGVRVRSLDCRTGAHAETRAAVGRAGASARAQVEYRWLAWRWTPFGLRKTYARTTTSDDLDALVIDTAAGGVALDAFARELLPRLAPGAVVALTGKHADWLAGSLERSGALRALGTDGPWRCFELDSPAPRARPRLDDVSRSATEVLSGMRGAARRALGIARAGRLR